MRNQDIRWIQRFQNLKNAYARFSEAVQAARTRELSDLEKQGVIQAFEFTHELTWKTLKDFFIGQSILNITGSKDVNRIAYQHGLIDNPDVWFAMIESRNASTHVYEEEIADQVIEDILERYADEFTKLMLKLEELEKQELE